MPRRRSKTIIDIEPNGTPQRMTRSRNAAEASSQQVTGENDSVTLQSSGRTSREVETQTEGYYQEPYERVLAPYRQQHDFFYGYNYPEELFPNRTSYYRMDVQGPTIYNSYNYFSNNRMILFGEDYFWNLNPRPLRRRKVEYRESVQLNKSKVEQMQNQKHWIEMLGNECKWCMIIFFCGVIAIIALASFLWKQRHKI